MSFDFFTLQKLWSSHPAWRLLRSPNSLLILSFLHRTFISPNIRTVDEAELVEKLEDTLYQLRAEMGEAEFPKSAKDYLNDWADPQNAWLRKFYKIGSDEAQFDLMPATEKAINWLNQLTERQFIGTESRLLTLFSLLKEIQQGSEVDPGKRIAELEKQRADIGQEIEKIRSGEVSLLGDTAIKERYLQFSQTARELLSDFREVEHNFLQLDTKVRKQIALWEGSKGELLAEIMGERDAITDSDQGRSFRAFWDFLLSEQRQQEFSQLLEKITALPALKSLNIEQNQQHIHYDWLEAGEHTQRTVARLSQQLRHFLDDKAWIENRRIMSILREIEGKVFQFEGKFPKGETLLLDDTKVSLNLPFERPLYNPETKIKLNAQAIENADEIIDSDILFHRTYIDKKPLIAHIRKQLAEREQISLKSLIEKRPLKQGIAELITYLQLENQRYFTLVIDENVKEIITLDGSLSMRTINLPKVIFSRN